MKTLTINRPIGLRLFAHKTNPPLLAANFSREQVERGIQTSLAASDGSFTCNGALAWLRYFRHGAQLVVANDLSRDLEVSSVVGDLTKLVWPAETLHVIFADPELPSLLVDRKQSGVVNARGNLGGGIFLSGHLRAGADAGALLANEDWQKYCTGAEIARIRTAYEDEINSEEVEAIRYLAILFAKVLGFASVPRHVPIKLTTRAEKKAAGIHPNQQTSAPTLLYRHLPRIVRDPVEAPGGTTGAEHRFMGRAGHLRFYESDRYVNMKGQWQWIPPIPPPEGIQVVYKVRKVEGEPRKAPE